DRNPEKVRELRRESGVKAASDLKSAVEQASMAVVAVRPGAVAGMLAAVKASGVAPGLYVSLAAGIPLPDLRAAFPGAGGVRARPSPVCGIAKGLTSVCVDLDAGKGDRAQVRDFFGRVGHIVEIPERKFDAFTAAFSSSHGYHAVRTLAEQARRAGLD